MSSTAKMHLIEVRRETGDVKVVGYIAALAEQGPTRGPQHLFVNRRIVKDRTIAHAMIDVYSVASIKERSPEMHLFIAMPHTPWTSTCIRRRPKCGSATSRTCTR